MATDFIKPKSLDNSRFADETGAYLAICDTPVTRTISSEFIIVLLAECNSHNGATEVLRIEWENTTDALGVWNQLQAAAGEIRQGTGTALVNCTSPSVNMAGGLCECDTPLQDSHEIEGAISATMSVPNKDIVDMYFAIDPSNADPGDVYSFRLYSVTGASILNDGSAWNVTYTAGAPQIGSEDLPGEFEIRKDGSEELLGEFVVRKAGSQDLPAEFIVQQEGSADLLGEFIVRHEASVDLGAGFDSHASADLLAEFFVNQDSEDLGAEFRIRCPPLMGENLQNKMWYAAPYYWRGRYDPIRDEFIFEYISEAGLAGNSWTKNANASIDVSGFVDADFAICHHHDGQNVMIHYSDGVDTWIAESDKASATGWAWENLTKVFDGTAPDLYRMPNVSVDQQVARKCWATAVFYDQSEGKYWVKARRQTTSGDITAWDAAVDISNVDNVATILGQSLRSMGAANGVDMIFIYKEQPALRSRYYDGDWDAAIQTIDATTHPGSFRWNWDFEHGDNGGSFEAHILYCDADHTVQWGERSAGAAAAWNASVQVGAAHAGAHSGFAIVEHGPGWLWAMWGEEEHQDIHYRMHLCAPETWFPALVADPLEFDVTTVPPAVVSTTTVAQIHSPDTIPAGAAVPLTWIGETAPETPCSPGWGIILPRASEELKAIFQVGQNSVDLPGEFVIRRTATADLPAEFIIRHETSVDLPGEFIIQHETSIDLLGEFIIRREASVDLAAAFDAQTSVDLPAEFIVRREASVTLPAEFLLGEENSVDLLAEFISQQAGSADLLSEFIVRYDGSQDLLAGFDGQTSIDLPAEFIVQTALSPGSADLLAEFIIRRSASADLLGEFIVRHEASVDLGAGFDSHASADLLAEFIARQEGSADLLGEFIVRGIYEELLDAAFSVRHTNTRPLFSQFCVHTPRIGQDLSTWIEYDPEEELGHDCNDSWWQDIPRLRADTALTKDVGAAGIGSDFFHELTLNVFDVTATTNGFEERICAWAGSLAIIPPDFYGLNDFQVAALLVMATDTADQYQLKLIEKGGNEVTMATIWPNYQDRYIIIYKEGTKLIALSYQDAAHTILEDRAEITLSGDLNFRYISMPMAYGHVGAESSSGYIDPIFGSFEQLPAEFEVRHIGIPVDLSAEFEVGQWAEDLPAEFNVQALQSGSQELLAEFVSRRQIASQELLGELIIRHEAIRNLLGVFDGQVSLNLPVEFITRHKASRDLSAEFEVVHVGLPGGLPSEFIVRHSASRDLAAGFDGQVSLNLPAEFRVRCPRRFGGNWQRKMWFDGTYYWRGRYCPTDDRLEFEYIAAAGLAGNVWTENTAARISGFLPGCVVADFTVRGGESGIPTTIHYSDGFDSYVAESDEASATGWAWQNLTKVFDATAPDCYRLVNLAANRTTPIPKLWVIAVFRDDSEGKQWVKARTQTTGGDITGWDAEVPVSNVNNTNTIYGCSARSMGAAGPLRNDILFVYKEGTALRSKYYDGDWDAAIQTIDATTIAGHSSFDFEHGDIAGMNMGHVVYVDGDTSIKWRERDSGAAEVWGAVSQLHGANITHRSVGIIEHGSNWLWVTWAHGDEAEYRFHACNPETWWPLLGNNPETFDSATSPPAVVTTTTIDQLQTPDAVPAGSAIPICWIGQTGVGTPCEPGWGILIPEAQEDLPGEFVIRHSASRDLAAGFNGQVSLNLPCEFFVRNAGIVDLPAEFVVAQWQEDLPGEFIIRHFTFLDLAGTFEAQVSLNIPSEFVIRRKDLRNLPAEFVILQGWEDLPAEFFLRNAATRNLPAEFIPGRLTALDLSGEFFVRNAGFADLSAAFEGQVSLNLLGEFVVRHLTTLDFPSEFVVRHPSYTGSALVIAYDLKAFFNYSEEIGTGFLAWPHFTSDTEVKIAGHASLRINIGRTSKGSDYIQFGWRYRNPVWGEDTWPGTYINLEELPAKFFIPYETSVNLLGEFVIRKDGFVNLPAEFEVGQSSADLKAGFDSQISLNLKAGFRIRQGFNDLPAYFEVMVEGDYTTWTHVWTRDYSAGINFDGFHVSNIGTVFASDSGAEEARIRTYAGAEDNKTDYMFGVLFNPRWHASSVLGKYLVAQNTAGVNHTLEVWKDGVMTDVIEIWLDNPESSYPELVGMSPNGKYIAVGAISSVTMETQLVMLYEGS